MAAACSTDLAEHVPPGLEAGIIYIDKKEDWGGLIIRAKDFTSKATQGDPGATERPVLHCSSVGPVEGNSCRSEGVGCDFSLSDFYADG